MSVAWRERRKDRVCGTSSWLVMETVVETRRFRAVSCVLFFEGKILMLKRNLSVRTNPGLWSVVAGEIDAGEEPVDTAHREIREEVGLAPSDVELLRRGGPFEVQPKPGSVTSVYTFLFLASRSDVKLNEEHTEYRWASIGEASALDTVPKFDEMLRSLGLTGCGPSKP
ncbi:MAG: NUDIX domain-containing protein [Thaumarchaeota archaeon]|nr:NUDIX domain-containing protein [Nitrososphaerota archaeon]